MGEDISETSTPLLSYKEDPNLEEGEIEQYTPWPQLIQALLVSLAWAFDAQQCFITVFTDSLSYPSNIVSDWSLQNSGTFLTGLPTSSFYIGCIVGAILLTTLADTCLGRKNLLVLSCFIMSISGILTSLFATNIYLYSALRFICGFGRASIVTCSLVLAGELVPARWRSHLSVSGFILFTFGFASIPAISYFNRNSSWRNIYMWTSLPALLYTLTIHFFVTESPRCLSVKTESVNMYSAMGILISRRWSCRRLILMMVICFGLGIIYYGMPLGLGNLSFNLYISVAMSALTELPASFATFVLIRSFNRKSSMLVMATLSGICSIFCGALTGSSSTLQVAMELASFFCGTTALDLGLIYATELFPTCVRNSAVSLVRLAMVFGAGFGPMLVAAGRGMKFVTYGLFGVVTLACGVFVIWLPETKGVDASDTVEEEDCKEWQRSERLLV